LHWLVVGYAAIASTGQAFWLGPCQRTAFKKDVPDGQRRTPTEGGSGISLVAHDCTTERVMMTDNEADHLLGQMIDDIATDYDSDVANGWLEFWERMPANDRMSMARRGVHRLLDLAFERGIKPGHPAFPRVGVMFAAFNLALRQAG
jgi:hypothetical protein